MVDIHDLAMNWAKWLIFQLRNSHPWKISTTHYFLFSWIEVAIIALIKVLMPLEEVNHLVTDLRGVEILKWMRLCFLQMSLDNLLSNRVNFFAFEILEDLIFIFFEYLIIV
jgi:hypothetical protein